MRITIILAFILLPLANLSAQGALPSSASEIQPILVGSNIPTVILTDVNNEPFDLMAAVKSKPTILVYYRGGWWGHCLLQLGELQSVKQELEDIGYQIIAASTDAPADILKTIEGSGITFTLLSDQEMVGGRAFGLAWDDTRNNRILPVPAVFVLDQEGIIQFEHVNPDYRTRLDVEVLTAMAKAALR